MGRIDSRPYVPCGVTPTSGILHIEGAEPGESEAQKPPISNDKRAKSAALLGAFLGK
jgi:hypothetical protein